MKKGKKAITKKKPIILIVEDENIIALDLQNTIKALGWKVCAITSEGEESIRLAERCRPDLVLMDIRLKGEMNGVEAAAVIRNNLNIPILYLTAHGDDDKRFSFITKKGASFVPKPFSEQELRNKMTKMLS